MPLRMPRSALEIMLAHARREAPLECCGLLVGAGDRVTRVVPARNLRASPTRYLVDPESHFKARRRAREEGLAVLGAYHSHPAGPAIPSPVDVEEAHEDGFVHVIIAAGQRTDGEAVRAYVFAGGRFDGLEVILDEA